MPNAAELNPAIVFAAESELLQLAAADTLFGPEHSPAFAANADSKSFLAIDEVGRGCLAGPVVVCITLWSESSASAANTRWSSALRDSKKLSLAQREALFRTAVEAEWIAGRWETLPPIITQMQSTQEPCEFLSNRISLSSLKSPHQVVKKSFAELSESLSKMHAIRAKKSKQKPSSLKVCSGNFGLVAAYLGCATAGEIDAHGIIPSLGLAASRALAQLPRQCEPAVVFFDGNRPIKLAEPWNELRQILVTKGDNLLKSISASSVIAKVVRDQWMQKYSEMFPNYAFEENRGYGTEKHRNAIEKHGPTPLHRRSFLKNLCPQLHP